MTISFITLETNDFFDDGRPPVARGANTYRKARGGMSLASGYLTPNSRKTDNLSPLTKLSLKSEYTSPNTGKENTDIAASTYYNTPRSQRISSKSPQKRAFCKSWDVCLQRSPHPLSPWVFPRKNATTS